MDKPQAPDLQAVDAALNASAQQQGLDDFTTAMQRRVARAAALLLVLVMLAALAQMLIQLMSPDPDPAQRGVRLGVGAGFFVMAALALAGVWRLGRRAAAAFICGATMLALMAAAAFYGIGVMSSGMGALCGLVVILGLMVGPRAAAWAAVTSVAGLVALWGAQELGWIGDPAAHTSPFGHLVVVCVSIALCAWLVLRYGSMFWEVSRSLDASRQLLADTLWAQHGATRALRDSEERLRRLLDSAHTAVQIYDGQTGELRYANAQCLRAYGVSRLMELGPELMCPAAPFDAAQALLRVQQTMLDGEQYFEWQSRHLDGSPIWWDVKMDRFALGEEMAVVAFAHDITQRVKAEQALREQQQKLEDEVQARTKALHAEQHRTQELIEALPILLCVRDANGVFLQINRAFERATHLPRERILGHTVSEVLSGSSAEETLATDADVLRQGRGLNTERQMQQLDGVHDYLVTTVPFSHEEGKPLAALSMSTDVTSLKRLHRDLAQARDEAERHAQVKTQFLANMSHEIRTPLNAVLGLAQLGEQRSQDPRAAADSFRRIVRAGRHLLGVINDVLDYAKMDTGKLELDNQPCDLELLLRDVMEMVTERAQAKGLDLKSEIQAVPPWVAMDALRVTQVLANLLSNAVKFTEHGGVSVTVRSRRNGARLLFEVRDTGVGIAAEKLENIFSPFEQGDSSVTRLYGGTGLGLSISRKLAQLMGGDIRVSSRQGEGSCFTLELPLIEAKAVQTSPSEPSSPGASCLQGLRVLVVDDVDINREILQDMLGQAGAEVMAADSGERAVQLVKEQGPCGYDLVLMDVQMPGMDGYQATHLVHAVDPELPVWALTAHAMAEERQRSLDAGMVGHVCKPVDREELLKLLQHHRPRPRPVHAPALPVTPALSAPGPVSSRWPVLEQADFETAVSRCAGRTDLLTKLLHSFANQYAQHQSDLEEARIQGLMSVRAYAHRVRGVASNLGLSGLAHTAERLEAQCRQGEMDAAWLDAITALNRDLAAHLQAIRVWRDARLADAA